METGFSCFSWIQTTKKKILEKQLTIIIMALVLNFTRQVWIRLNKEASKTKWTYCKSSIVETK